MAENSWPFEDTDTTEPQWSDIFRRVAGTGTISGLALSASGGMGISVASGSAFVRGFYYENTATKVLTADASTANPRKDYVVRRLDLGANSITTAILKGTANSGGGTLPVPTQDPNGIWEVPVGIVTIPANAVNLVAANVVALPTFAPVTITPYTGDLASVVVEEYPALAVNVVTNVLSLNTGSGWQNVQAPVQWSDIQGKPSVQLTTDELDAGRLTGTTPLGVVPDLPASKVTSGQFDAARIPSIVAAKISDPENLTSGDTTKIDGAPIYVQQTDPGAVADGSVWIGW